MEDKEPESQRWVVMELKTKYHCCPRQDRVGHDMGVALGES